ncbi:hypothetical protein GCM10011399_19610 [Subtercola lobariae]|uniref:Uncharacterized protein n=1 Tax=Subtercola lobariae TaxID=1588641 RepID=A0A917B6N5_9MICO|nr:hypothetical protein GCM10011399_19610 [Subtercola lobariae]
MPTLLTQCVNTIRYLEHDYDGESRIFIIGTDRHGRFLEIVAVPSPQPNRIIHADLLRPQFYHYL